MFLVTTYHTAVDSMACKLYNIISVDSPLCQHYKHTLSTEMSQNLVLSVFWYSDFNIIGHTVLKTKQGNLGSRKRRDCPLKCLTPTKSTLKHWSKRPRSTLLPRSCACWVLICQKQKIVTWFALTLITATDHMHLLSRSNLGIVLIALCSENGE